jgi:hypothetical protein
MFHIFSLHLYVNTVIWVLDEGFFIEKVKKKLLDISPFVISTLKFHTLSKYCLSWSFFKCTLTGLFMLFMPALHDASYNIQRWTHGSLTLRVAVVHMTSDEYQLSIVGIFKNLAIFLSRVNGYFQRRLKHCTRFKERLAFWSWAIIALYSGRKFSNCSTNICHMLQDWIRANVVCQHWFQRWTHRMAPALQGRLLYRTS